MGKIGFSIFNHFIAYYGLEIALGLLFALTVAYLQIKHHNLVWNDFIIIAATGGLFGIIGAKALYFIISYQTIDFSRILEWNYLSSVMQGGFVFYGGLLGSLFGLWICQKNFHINIYDYLKRCTPCIPIAHGFGRIGCYLVGCCHGIPFDSCISVIYTESLYAPNHIPLFPVQLIEAIGDFLIATILLIAEKKVRAFNPLSLYLCLYSIMRFFLEFTRYDAIRGILGWFSTSQIISIAVIIIVFLQRLNYQPIKSDK